MSWDPETDLTPPTMYLEINMKGLFLDMMGTHVELQIYYTLIYFFITQITLPSLYLN